MDYELKFRTHGSKEIVSQGAPILPLSLGDLSLSIFCLSSLPLPPRPPPRGSLNCVLVVRVLPKNSTRLPSPISKLPNYLNLLTFTYPQDFRKPNY